MPLVFSPLSEEVLDSGPAKLFPKTVFLMRQLGAPPKIDQAMAALATQVFENAGISVLDANSSTAGKDFLERILGLIRGSGFVAALFSNETRRTAFANILLELGFAAMCGKPLIIIKSKNAEAPSILQERIGSTMTKRTETALFRSSAKQSKKLTHWLILRG
jgi:hypothetical protein